MLNISMHPSIHGLNIHCVCAPCFLVYAHLTTFMPACTRTCALHVFLCALVSRLSCPHAHANSLEGTVILGNHSKTSLFSFIGQGEGRGSRYWKKTTAI